jgi:hypothetical protein
MAPTNHTPHPEHTLRTVSSLLLLAYLSTHRRKNSYPYPQEIHLRVAKFVREPVEWQTGCDDGCAAHDFTVALSVGGFEIADNVVGVWRRFDWLLGHEGHAGFSWFEGLEGLLGLDRLVLGEDGKIGVR